MLLVTPVAVLLLQAVSFEKGCETIHLFSVPGFISVATALESRLIRLKL